MPVLPLAQLRTAHALAGHHGHEWAGYIDPARPHPLLALRYVDRDGDVRPVPWTTEFIAAAVASLRDRDPGISAPEMNDRGEIVHQTISGRSRWVIRQDGSALLSIHRPLPEGGSAPVLAWDTRSRVLLAMCRYAVYAAHPAGYTDDDVAWSVARRVRAEDAMSYSPGAERRHDEYLRDLVAVVDPNSPVAVAMDEVSRCVWYDADGGHDVYTDGRPELEETLRDLLDHWPLPVRQVESTERWGIWWSVEDHRWYSSCDEDCVGADKPYRSRDEAEAEADRRNAAR